jgi:hypothetical protein
MTAQPALLDKMEVREFKVCAGHLEHQETMDYKVLQDLQEQQGDLKEIRYMRVRKKNTKKNNFKI